MAYSSRAFAGGDVHDDQFNLQPQVQVNGAMQRYERSLIPCTIRQIMTSPEPEADEPFRIDGVAVHQVAVIATVQRITPNSTHTLFLLEDHGPCIQAKLWSSSNQDIDQIVQHDFQTNDLAKVIGKIDVFNHEKCINIHHIEKVECNKNEVTQHLLEAIFAHQLNTVIANKHIGHYEQRYKDFMQHSQNVYHGRVPVSPQRGLPPQHQQQYGSPMHNHSHSHTNQRSVSPHQQQSRVQPSHVQPSPLQHQQQQQQQYQYQHSQHHNNHNHNNRSNVNSNMNDILPAGGLAARVQKEERPFNPLERKVLHWMRTTPPSHQFGHKREVIKSGVGHPNWTPFDEALVFLFQCGLITETMADHWQICKQD